MKAIDMLGELLKENLLDPTVQDEDGITPLMSMHSLPVDLFVCLSLVAYSKWNSIYVNPLLMCYCMQSPRRRISPRPVVCC